MCLEASLHVHLEVGLVCIYESYAVQLEIGTVLLLISLTCALKSWACLPGSSGRRASR